MDQQLLAKVLKEAMKGGRYSVGVKEVISEMKGSKLIVCTNSVTPTAGKQIEEEAKKNNVSLVRLDRNSTEMGRMVGRPFRVSALAIRTVSDADLKQLTAA